MIDTIVIIVLLFIMVILCTLIYLFVTEMPNVDKERKKMHESQTNYSHRK